MMGIVVPAGSRSRALRSTTATLSAVAVLLALTTGAATSAILLAPAPAAAADSKASLKVGPTIKDAQALVTQKKYKDAVAKLQEADAMSGKTAYDGFLIQQLLAAAYSGMQDYGNAAKAMEAVLATGQEPESQKTARLKQIAQMYYQAKNSAKFYEYANRYIKDVGGSDPEMQMFMAQAAYNEHNYKLAADTAQTVIKTAESKGQPVKEEWLQFVRGVDHEGGNAAGEQEALERLAQRYQKPEYWNSLLIVAQKTIKGGTSTELDIDRIMFATGVMATAKEYAEMAELALSANLSVEAKRIIEVGLKKNVLGQPADKTRTARLLNVANAQADADMKALPIKDEEAKAAPAGEADVKVGEQYWAAGQYDKAVEAIQRGIKKGLRVKDDAQLRLGIAYLSAGKKAQAQEAFKAITPNTPPAQVARLWMLLGTAKQI